MGKKNRQGQSLWEVIIALSIAGLIALGLVRATSSSVKSTRFSSDQSRLTALAQEKISQIVNYKNKNPKSFWESVAAVISSEDLNLNEDYCLLTKVVDDTVNLPPNTPNPEKARMAKITVDVFWERKSSSPECKENDFNHKLHFETNVTN